LGIAQDSSGCHGQQLAFIIRKELKKVNPAGE